MPPVDEILRCLTGALYILDEHPGNIDPRNILVQEHDIAALANELGQRTIVWRVGEHAQAIDMMVAQAVERRDLAPAVRARRGDEDGVAVPVCLVLHCRSEFGIARLAYLGDDESDCV